MLAHSAAHKEEAWHQHNRERVSQPADFAGTAAEGLNDCIADEAKCQAMGPVPRFNITDLVNLRRERPEGRPSPTSILDAC